MSYVSSHTQLCANYEMGKLVCLVPAWQCKPDTAAFMQIEVLICNTDRSLSMPGFCALDDGKVADLVASLKSDSPSRMRTRCSGALPPGA